MEADEASNRTAGEADRPTSNTVSSMRFGAYPALMAITERTFAVSLAGLFATLAHPDAYADWLVGGPDEYFRSHEASTVAAVGRLHVAMTEYAGDA